ncbi:MULTISPECIES: prepilin peptidase [unclassified Burkholderia]|uniref:A24 family peptidase n=1 Tax=unclassified Burkholderia TaxID=2613784 RepID=UPI000F55B0C9|nr:MULTISPECIES: prepilin peptidase [unclassified Burkholderia]RQR74926.1 prepilin peptidase [Burkholderia sp. Bp9011]RQR86130.1 prepilin peptidase [Burkholderia sp. Bp9010]RQS00675.1 prepilin peptidase [Burkholderia sp. Bp8991]RQS67396.1 prepilin peptidase [Burkholderia sp. Bp8977]
MKSLFFAGAFVAWAALVAISDIRFRRIRNSLAVAGLVGALLCALANENPFGVSLVQALIGALCGLICLFPFFALRLMGAADVKIFAVMGAWCGTQALLWIWIAASIAACVHALGMMFISRMSVGELFSHGMPTMVVGNRRATPYAAFLVMPAVGWLGYLMVQRAI